MRPIGSIVPAACANVVSQAVLRPSYWLSGERSCFWLVEGSAHELYLGPPRDEGKITEFLLDIKNINYYTREHRVHKNGISADFKFAFLSLLGLSFRILS